MDTSTAPPVPTPDHLGPLGVARLLVLLQGGVLLAGAVEAAVVAGAMGPATMPNVLLTAAGGLLTLLAVVGLRRGSRWARRWTIVVELGVLALVAVDVAIGFILGGPDLPLMTLVLRVATPIAVIAILCRDDVRVRFARAVRPAVGADAATAASAAAEPGVPVGAGAPVGGAA